MSIGIAKQKIAMILKWGKILMVFSIKLDKSTDVTKNAVLLYFVRVACQGELKEEHHISSTCWVEQPALRFFMFIS